MTLTPPPLLSPSDTSGWFKRCSPSFLFGLLTALAFSTGCFSPEINTCAVTCDATRPCPGDNVCLSDGFCHASSGAPLCGSGGDAGTDGPDQIGDCGNGVVQLSDGEECDDDNATSGDGCSSACVIEDDYVCVDQPSICRIIPTEPGQLVITELMLDPEAVGDEFGEWFEIHNPTTTDMDLMGLSFLDPGSGGENALITQSLPLEADGHIVVTRTVEAMNGGIEPDFIYNNMQLGNNADELEIRNGETVIDRVEWSINPTMSGAANNLSSATYTADDNNNLNTNFCEATTNYGAGDRGTPGTRNPACASATQRNRAVGER